MDATRLKQIEEIYHAAIEIQPDERESFFREHCGADENLRREVESLLSFENTFDSLIDTPPESLAAELFFERERQTNLIGREITHYKIKRLLGKGGMGEVYLADDINLNRQVALKILPPEFAADKNRMSRFVREAKSASALNHPNIITIYEIGKSEGTHFIATEFIDGKTLKEYAKRDSLNFKSALEIAIQIASALDEAHSAGIVHRDIKPDNVMIRSNGLVKILDFGIAKLSSSNNPQSLDAEAATAIKSGTTPGMIIGTANYMSPEQAKGKEVDARTDIFSFGVVLYEMMAGNLPFEGETAMEMIGAILKDEPKPLDKTEVPSEIEKIIGKCLRKDRDERYQTIKDVLIDLKDVRQDLEFQNKSERTISPEKEEPKTQILQATTADEIQQTTTNETISGKPKSNQLLAVGLAILLVSAIGFFGYRYFTASKQIESIAVMPFVNESGNQDVEYLSDGMTETLIGSLSQVPNLRVKARSSVFRYKGKDTNAQTIGMELNVQAILYGRVVQRGDQLTLNLELIDAPTENVIWSESYNRRQTDLVSLQSEIARDVSGKLKIKLSGVDEAKVARTSTIDPDAYQAYLKGRYYWNRRTAENLKKAIEQFKSATDRDPNYALAYAGLADCYAVLNQYATTPASETIPQAKNYAERAIAIDDQLAEPHASLGQVNVLLWQWTEAEREYKRAIELNPNYATAYHWYSILLRDLGRFDESAVMIKRAHELDPLSSIISINLSQVYQIQNNQNASIENTLKVIELDPNYSGAYNNLAMSYLKLGRNSEAIANFEKAVELSNRADVVLRNLGYGYGVAGKRTEALAIAKELEEKYAKKKSMGQFTAAVYAGLGDKDKVFEWLEKDFQNKEDLAAIRWSSQFESLRDDPRLKDLLKRMNLPE
ncbi:MAG: protein kinase [Acidobacteria bacterium]|jgi:serine/threonine-protein kinase|nr:protein kinase [Acidobacteriota bacterium]